VTLQSRRQNPDVETLMAEALAFFDGCGVPVTPEIVRVERLVGERSSPDYDTQSNGERIESADTATSPSQRSQKGSRWLVSIALTLPSTGTQRREKFDTWLSTRVDTSAT